MKKELLYLLLVVALAACTITEQPDTRIKNDLRAPAYPLITLHPDVSIWAVNDTLSAQAPRFFDRERDFPFVGALRVDGIVYRFLGDKKLPLQPLAPISYEETWKGNYVLTTPEANWQQPHFDDSQWRTGTAAFGTSGQRSVKTLWPSPHIWIRREISLDRNLIADRKLYLRYSHDDVFQLYINGIPLVSTGFEWKRDIEIQIPDSIVKTMTEGKATIAAHCENRMGGALVDFGIYAAPKRQSCFDSIAIQKSVDVQATQTHYAFQCGGVTLKLSFTAPQLMNDLELLSRPINYISYQITSSDGKEHNAEIYFELASQQAFNADQIDIYKESRLLLLKMGNSGQKLWSDQNGIAPAWGYFYLGSERANGTYAIGDATVLRKEFAEKGNRSLSDTSTSNTYVAITQSLDTSKETEGSLLVGFDGLYTMEYFGENLRPYWNRKEDHSMEEEMLRAYNEQDKVLSKATQFDHQLMVDALLAGGKEYAELCALAYRQAVTPFQLSEAPNGDLLFFTKEVGPVDGYYPAAPVFLYYNPKLMEAMLNPIFHYSESGRWTKPYPAHDLGGYPVANGQTHGGDMPIEEAGNMLILTAAITRIENDVTYAKKHWKVLSQWAGYLLKNGIDTGTQPCTDNFAGPCPHNANLSIKGILGLASYSYLAEMLEQFAIAQAYKKIVRKRTMEWEKKAYADTHYRIALTQDNDSSWSQKYNLVWDKILALNVFPDSISQKEIAFYLTQIKKYGLPLDDRHEYTKTDWSVWTASLAKDRESFRKLIKPLHRFMNETPDRVPMSDLIHTEKNTREAFAARPVVGGIYIKMLRK